MCDSFPLFGIYKTMQKPIAVFDSGAGGLSVLSECVKLMPDRHFLYFADTLNAPYGDYSEDKICSLVLESARKISKFDVQALVVACNTATSAAIKQLRLDFDFGIIGIEPAIKTAKEQTNGKILLLATSATLRQQKLRDLIIRVFGDNPDRITTLALPKLVSHIENNLSDLDTPQLSKYLSDELKQFKEYSAVVLGCTHYSLIKHRISEALNGIKIIDGNYGVARALFEYVSKNQAAGNSSVSKLDEAEFFVSCVKTAAGYCDRRVQNKTRITILTSGGKATTYMHTLKGLLGQTV